MRTQSPSVALVTAEEVRDLDDEGQLLARRLREVGVDVSAEVWDDPTVIWAEFDLVVVRSTWDYALRHEAFVAWADRVTEQSRIANPAELLRWSTDKRYLDDLAAAGVPVVPSTFIGSHDSREHELLGHPHVVKPAISAGSKDTVRIEADGADLSRRHIGAILGSGRTALVQPYLAGIDEGGETALIYIDGSFSHAVGKGPILRPGAGLVDGLVAAEEVAARDASEAELAAGARAIAAIPSTGEGPPLYARVDLLPDAQGGPLVLELELAEPSLFLQYHEPAAERFANAIYRRLRP